MHAANGSFVQPLGTDHTPAVTDLMATREAERDTGLPAGPDQQAPNQAVPSDPAASASAERPFEQAAADAAPAPAPKPVLSATQVRGHAPKGNSTLLGCTFQQFPCL
jgi:hypothetical protein